MTRPTPEQRRSRAALTAPSADASDGAPWDGDPKLAPPVLRDDVVVRERLLGRLLAPRDERVVAVIGPAGYGKTTLLAQWRRGEQRPVAWLTLDAGDADPQVLLRYLARAIDRAVGLPSEVLSSLRWTGVTVTITAVSRLASALHRSPAPMLLIVDDVHAIDGSTAMDALAMLVAYLPADIEIVLAGRHAAGLPLARWRAAGRLLELGPAELALDEAEAANAVSLLDARLGQEMTRRLYHATEGWPAALYLATRAGKAGGATGPAGLGFVGHRDISAYLDDELLHGQSAGTRTFLLRTAILDRLTAGLCDAVTGERGSGARLEHLAATDHLVTPVDEEGGRVYRYHALLREHLLAALDREGIDRADLHRRAADWHLQHGDRAAAIDHRFAAGDLDVAADLLEPIAFATYRDGRAATFDRWIGLLEDAHLQDRPMLAAVATLTHVLRGHVAPAERLADVMGRGLRSAAADLETVGPIAAFIRALMARDGIDIARRDAQAAYDGVPEDSTWRPGTILAYGGLLTASGDLDAADEMLRRLAGTAAAIGAGRTRAAALAIRSTIAIRRDSWVIAGRLAEEAATVAAADGHVGEVSDALAWAVAAHTATRRGNLPTARRDLASFQTSMASLSAGAPWLAILALLEACKAYLALADHAGARTMLRHAEDILHHRPGLGPLADAVEGLGRQMRTLPPGAAGASTLTLAEIRVLLLLPTYLSVPEIAARLYVSPNTVRTQIQAIYGKLGATSRAEAVETAIAAGLLEPLPILADERITTV